MSILKSPGMFVKNAVTLEGIDKKDEVKEDDSNKQFSPEFEAILKEYEGKGVVNKE